MSPVTIPYSPGYSDAIHAWVTYLWKRHRRPLLWLLVLLGTDVLLIANGISGLSQFLDHYVLGS